MEVTCLVVQSQRRKSQETNFMMTPGHMLGNRVIWYTEHKRQIASDAPFFYTAFLGENLFLYNFPSQKFRMEMS
jgi:hypothetical protein